MAYYGSSLLFSSHRRIPSSPVNLLQRDSFCMFLDRYFIVILALLQVHVPQKLRYPKKPQGQLKGNIYRRSTYNIKLLLINDA